jgi:hypothetical protein
MEIIDIGVLFGDEFLHLVYPHPPLPPPLPPKNKEYFVGDAWFF